MRWCAWVITDQHLIHDDSQAPPVAELVVSILHEDLWSDVVWCSHCGERLTGTTQSLLWGDTVSKRLLVMNIEHLFLHLSSRVTWDLSRFEFLPCAFLTGLKWMRQGDKKKIWIWHHFNHNSEISANVRQSVNWLNLDRVFWVSIIFNESLTKMCLGKNSKMIQIHKSLLNFH